MSSILQNTSLQQEMTLLIPTFNRPNFLRKLLKYYDTKKTLIKFIILDSSCEEIQKQNTIFCYKLAHARIKYLSFNSSTPFATKLVSGLQSVETNYCAFCADDDVVFLEGLIQALVYLRSHPEYTCADGIYLNFNPLGDNIHLHIEYSSKGIACEDAGARVFRLFQKYESLFYGVYCSKKLLHIFESVARNSSLHYQELFQAVAALLLGKTERLPIIYAARQHCEAAEPTRDKWQTYYWFADNPKEFIDNYIFYRELLWDFYQKHIQEQKYPKKDFIKMLDVTHAMYFGLGFPPAYFHSALQTYWPNDLFKKTDILHDDVINELKNKKHLLWDQLLEKISKFLDEVPQLYSTKKIQSLNKKIQQETNFAWQCKLPKNLKWLAGVDHFRRAYYELCQYMSVN